MYKEISTISITLNNVPGRSFVGVCWTGYDILAILLLAVPPVHTSHSRYQKRNEVALDAPPAHVCVSEGVGL